MNDVIYLDDCPIPPQSNNMFENRIIRTRKGPRMGRMKSKDYVLFEHRFAEWAEGRDGILEVAQEIAVRNLRDQRTFMRVDMLISVPRHATADSRLAMWAQPKSKGRHGDLRVWDASNRIKAAHDCLSKALEIGDHYFTTGVTEKVYVDDDGPPCVTFRLSFHKVRSRTEAIEEFMRSQR